MTAVLAAVDTAGLLPSRPVLHAGEALDGYLERLADANHLRRGQLLDLLSSHRSAAITQAARSLMTSPDPSVVRAICDISGLQVDSVLGATLARFAAFPTAVWPYAAQAPYCQPTRGQRTAPGFGSQVCPRCLAEDGIWRVQWRLPIVAVCCDHATELVTHCCGCLQRFRSHSNAPLGLASGSVHACGNLIGRARPCPHLAVDHAVERTGELQVDATRIVLNALEGRSHPVLGVRTAPSALLGETSNLLTLLVELLSRRGRPGFVDWPDADFCLAIWPRSGVLHGRSTLPYALQHAKVRAGLLAAALGILGADTAEAAADRLRPWLGALAGLPAGPRGWLMRLTTRTPALDLVIDAATAGRSSRRASVSISGRRSAAAIPQLIDTEIYDRIFDDMLSVAPWTGRLYVSLCVVRASLSAKSWSQAAARIGLDAAIANDAARRALAGMRVRPAVFAGAVHYASAMLSHDRDFRRREDRVRTLVRDQRRWFPRWRASMPPDRRPATTPYAIAWMWCEIAQAPLQTSPGWIAPPTSVQRIAYRRFGQTLQSVAQATLRDLVMHPGATQ
jgi:TniQ